MLRTQRRDSSFEDVININITKHKQIAKFLKDNIKNNKFDELEDELSDMKDLDSDLENIEKEVTYEMNKVNEVQDKTKNEPNPPVNTGTSKYNSSESEISE